MVELEPYQLCQGAGNLLRSAASAAAEMATGSWRTMHGELPW